MNKKNVLIAGLICVGTLCASADPIISFGITGHNVSFGFSTGGCVENPDYVTIVEIPRPLPPPPPARVVVVSPCSIPCGMYQQSSHYRPAPPREFRHEHNRYAAPKGKEPQHVKKTIPAAGRFHRSMPKRSKRD